MKRFFTFAVVPLLFAAFTTSSLAKTTATSMTQVSAWLGTWNCVSGKDRYTATYTTLLNGAAMRVSDGGANAAEGIAKFDTSQNKWFYTAVFGSGLYLSMMGTVSGNTLSFTEVYPPIGATLTVRRLSATKYSDAFTMMSKGKKVSTSEVCTKS
jgi:hypothetical protein